MLDSALQQATDELVASKNEKYYLLDQIVTLDRAIEETKEEQRGALRDLREEYEVELQQLRVQIKESEAKRERAREMARELYERVLV